jgi:hypothetical protein
MHKKQVVNEVFRRVATMSEMLHTLKQVLHSKSKLICFSQVIEKDGITGIPYP